MRKRVISLSIINRRGESKRKRKRMMIGPGSGTRPESAALGIVKDIRGEQTLGDKLSSDGS